MNAGPHANVLGRAPQASGFTYTLFEGTSEIQRLVIARAASGAHTN